LTLRHQQGPNISAALLSGCVVIASGMRYEVADQVRALADSFDRFATRLEQEADALPKP